MFTLIGCICIETWQLDLTEHKFNTHIWQLAIIERPSTFNLFTVNRIYLSNNTTNETIFAFDSKPMSTASAQIFRWTPTFNWHFDSNRFWARLKRDLLQNVDPLFHFCILIEVVRVELTPPRTLCIFPTPENPRKQKK